MDSHRISRVPRYSGAVSAFDSHVAYGALTLCGAPFRDASAMLVVGTGDGPSTPAGALRHPRFGLLRVRSPLLAQSLLLSFPPGTEMFQFPGFAPAMRVAWSPRPGCPIRKSAGQWVFAPYRGLSQLVTSFFASESQGILHVPFSPFLVSFAVNYLGHAPAFSRPPAAASLRSFVGQNYLGGSRWGSAPVALPVIDSSR